MRWIGGWVLLWIGAWTWAQEFQYLGTHKCKACHKKEEKGNQYGIWLESKHAHVFALLYTENAKKFAMEWGLKKPPHEEAACVRCHVVGFGEGGYEIKDESFWNPPKDDKTAQKAVKKIYWLLIFSVSNY